MNHTYLCNPFKKSVVHWRKREKKFDKICNHFWWNR